MKQKSRKSGKAAHMEKLNKNVNDVRRLVVLVSQQKSHLNKIILRKGAMVLFTACWEAFIEDLGSASFDFLLKKCSGHKVIPDAVKSLAAKQLHTSNDPRDIWQLADFGWRKVLRKHARKTIDEFVGKIHTPNAENIDKMFQALIGIRGLSRNWKWRGIIPDAAKRKLGHYLTLRGQIAHRIASDSLITTDMVNDYVDFIFRLAVRSHNTVRSHLFKITKKDPWNTYNFRHTN